VDYQINGSLMIQFVRRRCPRVPYRMWMPKVLCRTGTHSVTRNLDAHLPILSQLKDFLRGLVGAYRSTFLFRTSCRLGLPTVRKRCRKGPWRWDFGPADGCFLLVPRTRIDTCRCEVVLRERDDDADSNAHEVGLRSSCRRYARLLPYRDRMSAALALACFR
jgi:hypothetical protein